MDYVGAVAYWSSQPATNDGMLGGYGSPRITRLDISHSKQFLLPLIARFNLTGSALDVGAGIGRITRDLLSVYFTVDLVEPVSSFCEVLRRDGIGRRIFEMGVQEFIPREKYAVIWNQWCLGQVSDDDLVAYLIRIKEYAGLICVKENIAESNTFDETDKSWTRSEESFLRIFKEAGLRVVKSSLQHGFPRELYKVKLWALQ